MLVTLVTTPLALGYLGPERYGVWMVVSSLIILLSVSDLGIGNGVMNEVARADAVEDRMAEARAIWSGGVLLTVVAALLGLGLLIVYPLVDWAGLYNVRSPEAAAEAGPVTLALVACFLIGLPISLSNQVRLAHQQGYLVNVFATVASLIGAALLIAAVLTRQPLPTLVIAVALPPLGAGVLNWLLIVRGPRAWLRPAWSAVRTDVGVQLLRRGGLFFVLQVAFAVGFSSDAIVAARVIGPTAVSEYVITQKLFSIPLLLVAASLGPLWPAYREALSRGDTEWARQTLARSIRLVVIIALPAATILVLAGSSLIRLWIGESVQPPFALILAFGAWAILGSLGNAVAIFLNGANEIAAQAVTATLMATANIALSVYLAANIGVAGVMWGTVIAYSLFSLLPILFYLPGVLRRIEARAAESRRTAVTSTGIATP